MDRMNGGDPSEFYIGHPQSSKIEKTLIHLPLDPPRGERYLKVNLALDEKNNRLYVLDRAGTLRLNGINLENNQVFLTQEYPQQGNSMVGFSPSGQYMLVSGINSAGLLDVEGLNFTAYAHELIKVNKMVWNPDNSQVFLQDRLTNKADQFCVIDLATAQADYLYKVNRQVSDDPVNLSPQWKYVAGEGKIYEYATLKEVGQLSTVGDPGPAAYSPQDDFVYSVSFKPVNGETNVSDVFIKFFSLEEMASKGVTKFRVQGKGLEENTPFAISPDGKYAAIGADELVVVDLQAREVKARFSAGERYGKPLTFTTLTFMPNTSRVFAGTNGNEVLAYDVATGKQICTLQGHAGQILSLSPHSTKDLLVSVGEDNQILWWDTQACKLIASMIVPAPNQYLVITPDGYFASNAKAVGLVAMKQGNSIRSFGPFDLKFNRPDIVWDRLGLASTEKKEMLKLARAKKLRQLGLKESDLVPPGQSPSIQWVSYQQEGQEVEVEIIARDKNQELKRLNVYINGVPVSGVHGRALSGKEAKINFKVPVQHPGNAKNILEVSVVNARGQESDPKRVALKVFLSEFYANGFQRRGQLVIVTIGISKFKQKEFNLTYAAKDAMDLAQKPYWGGSNPLVVLTDKEATRSNILQIKEKLVATTTPNDKVLIFISTHGILDKELNYYLATYDTDFFHPEETALKYEELEGLLRDIPAQNRLLFIDACHSGEVDKDLVTPEPVNIEQGAVAFRGFKGTGQMPQSGVKNSFELMKNVFGSQSQQEGINVIAASGGMEYALESPQRNNGVFSYALLKAFTANVPELEDGFSVTRLQQYLARTVRTLTRGLQTPSERTINPDNDFMLERVGAR